MLSIFTAFCNLSILAQIAKNRENMGVKCYENPFKHIILPKKINKYLPDDRLEPVTHRLKA